MKEQIIGLKISLWGRLIHAGNIKKIRLICGYGGVVFTFLGLLIYFLFISNPYLTPFLLNLLNKQGWGTFEVRDISLGVQQIQIEDVKYSPDPKITPMSIQSLKINMVWDLFYPKIQEIILKNIRIPKDLVKNILQSSAYSSSSSYFKVPSLIFEHAVVYSEDNLFPFNLSVNGTFIPGISFEAHVHFASLQAEGQGKIKCNLSSPSIKAYLSDFSLKAKKGKSIHLVGQGDLTLQEGIITTNLAGKAPQLKLRSHCNYHTLNQSGGCLLTFQASKLESIIPPQWLQLYSLKNVSGEVEGAAQFIIQKGLLKPIVGHAKLSRISFKHALLDVENLAIFVQYSFDKKLSFPQQRINILIDKADVGLPFSDIRLALSLDKQSTYYLHKGSASLQGGEITTKDVSLVFPFSRLHVPFEFKKIPAKFFVTLSKVPHLEISGNVGGLLDMEFNEHSYAIRKGSILLIQDLPGTIRYRPGKEPKSVLSLNSTENPLDLLLLALWDFEYDALSLNLQKNFEEKLQATLHLRGKNPHLLKGRSFDCTIKASGQLREVIENVFQRIRKP